MSLSIARYKMLGTGFKGQYSRYNDNNRQADLHVKGIQMTEHFFLL